MKSEHLPVRRVIEAENDLLFAQREEQIERTGYAMEKTFISVIKKGDIRELKDISDYIQSQGILTGNLSSNDVRQLQYLCVALITIATRAAIEEGMSQAEAYSISDESILHIDKLNEPEALLSALLSIAKRYAERIAASKKRYSRLIKRAKEYVSTHLHGDVTLEAIAIYCKMSPSYVSRRFHSETGETLHAYIMKQKLDEARLLIDTKNISCAEAANILGFSSQSHFISCYKKRFSITPGRYKKGGL